MNTRALNILFIVASLISAVLTYVFFNAWNPSSETVIKKGKPLTHMHIDACYLKKDRIYIQGWVIVPGVKKLLTSVYAEKKGGGFVKVEKSTQIRKDVTQAYGYGTEYDMSGFLASKLVVGGDEYSGNIILNSEDEKGGVYVADYKCK
ncbi:hypothetical protein ABV255_001376 [Citrobacter braakii]